MVVHSEELIRRAQAKQAKLMPDQAAFKKKWLTDAEVRQIKKWVFTRQYTQTAVAKMTGLSQPSINQICIGYSYRHVTYNGHYKMLLGKLYALNASDYQILNNNSN